MGKHLVLFALYELPDQNRDESVGNFQTLKKFHRLDGTYTFISKYSKRHHLFNELKNIAGWKESAVTFDDNNKVIQFDLTQDDVITSPELDAFGYMFTLGQGSGAAALTRKAAVGLTDLVSLEPYAGDSAFYANHDMVRRAQNQGQHDATPDIHNKEEHFSLYKGGMTINLNRLGIDDWVVDRVEEQNNSSVLEINLQRGTKTVEVEPLSEVTDYLKKVVEHYGALIDEPKYFKRKDANGFVVYGQIRNSNRYKVIFIVDEEERKKRVRDLLETYLSGFDFQVGGRAYALTPVFCAVAITKSPLQLFFPNVGVVPLGNGRFEVTGLLAPVANRRVEKVYLGWNPARIELDATRLPDNKVAAKDGELVNLLEEPDGIDEIIDELFSNEGKTDASDGS